LIGQGMLKPSLEARAAREGLSNVVFHAPVDKATLSGLMNATDVGLQVLANVPAFYYGTSPNKFFDCLAAGLPVLTNYPGWVADLVRDHQCGFAVPAENAAAFAQALVRAADDRAALNAMRQASRQLAREQFDRTQLAKEWVEWLEQAAR